jgi:hypothetical protein
MDAMKKTFSGREQLRSEGWVVDEADFADIIDPEEYANWSADADAQAYGEMAIMGFYKNIEIEIQEWQARGRSIEDTYIYFKDYVTYEDVIRIFAQETV